MPLEGAPRRLAIGRVTGGYRFRATARHGLRHTRPVEWLHRDVSLDLLGGDLRRSLGSVMKVSRPSVDPDGRRLAALAQGKPDPDRLME